VYEGKRLLSDGAANGLDSLNTIETLYSYINDTARTIFRVYAIILNIRITILNDIFINALMYTLIIVFRSKYILYFVSCIKIL